MKRTKLRLGLPLFFLVLSLFVNPVYAPIDITEFDDNLGSALGVGSFGGGLLLTTIILLFCLGTVGAASRRAPSTLMIALFSVCVMSFAVAASWFPLYFLTLVILIIAIMFGQRIIRGLK